MACSYTNPFPGTAVEDFKASEREVSFKVSGTEDAQITLELEADSEYVVYYGRCECR